MSAPVMTLMTVIDAHGPPSLETAAGQLGVTVDDIDKSFGVVPVDPQRGIYCVQVRADRLPAGTDSSKRYQGPFSNPKIAPFGPVIGKKSA